MFDDRLSRPAVGLGEFVEGKPSNTSLGTMLGLPSHPLCHSLTNNQEQEGRVAQEVAPPEPLRFVPEAAQPFEAVIGEPARAAHCSTTKMVD